MAKDLRIIGQSLKFKKLLSVADQVASSQASVLISGESGTGKEVLAKYIHLKSPRSQQPFIPINCSAIPDHLLESELFGHIRGSFTGALMDRLGLFEEAQGGTLFLDEIGDLDFSLQAKLLRVLQERKLRRVGENVFRSFNIRLICASHKNLYKEVCNGNFREDLYYRLNVIPLKVPPLRERLEDVLPLAKYFLEKYLVQNNLSQKIFSERYCEFLLSRPWNGNVRELENYIERSIIMSSSSIIEPSEDEQVDCFQSPSLPIQGDWVSEIPMMTLRELSRTYVKHVIQNQQGLRDKSAKILGIDRKTLYRWLNSYDNQ